MSMYRNPLTGRSVRKGGPTYRSLRARGLGFKLTPVSTKRVGKRTQPEVQVVPLDVTARALGMKDAALVEALRATCADPFVEDDLSEVAARYLDARALPLLFGTVLLVDGKPAGLAGFSLIQKGAAERHVVGTVYLDIFCVAPGLRSKGYGARFMRWSEALVQAWVRRTTGRSLTNIRLSPVERAKPFYKRLGYKPDRYYLGIMVKDFAAPDQPVSGEKEQPPAESANIMTVDQLSQITGKPSRVLVRRMQDTCAPAIPFETREDALAFFANYNNVPNAVHFATVAVINDRVAGIAGFLYDPAYKSDSLTLLVFCINAELSTRGGGPPFLANTESFARGWFAQRFGRDLAQIRAPRDYGRNALLHEFGYKPVSDLWMAKRF